MNLWERIKAKLGAVLVGLMLLIFILWGSSSKAGELYIDVGPTQVGSTFSGAAMLQLNNRISKHFDIGFGYIGEQEYQGFEIRPQLYLGTEFVVTDPWKQKARIGFGPYYFQNADRIGTSKFRAGISFEYRFTDRIGFKARHFSTAGSSPEITACRNDGRCFTNDWNTGQDSWARLVWYF